MTGAMIKNPYFKDKKVIQNLVILSLNSFIVVN